MVTGSKVKVNCDTVCIRPCGHDSDHSFAQSLSNFTCKLWMLRGRTLLIFGQRSRSTLALCVLGLLGTIQTTVYVQSLSNFTCRLWMMRRETLLIFDRGIIGQGQLCPLARGCHALRCLVLSYHHTHNFNTEIENIRRRGPPDGSRDQYRRI